MTISETLTDVAARLAQRDPESARTEAEWVLSTLLGISRTELYLRSGDTFPHDLVSRVAEIVAARVKSHPLQYLLGYAEFYGRRFTCDHRALIPRPETEILVETALAYLNAAFPAQEGIHPLVWDIGTGSGNIAVTLAGERPDFRVLATDIDLDALHLARENARLHQVADRVTMAAGSLLTAVAPAHRFAAICANPPYVSERAWEILPPDVRDFEPHRALFAPGDGLFFVRQIVEQAAEYLARGGLLALEIGFDQADAMRALLAAHGGYTGIRFTNDLAGHLRVACAVRI